MIIGPLHVICSLARKKNGSRHVWSCRGRTMPIVDMKQVNPVLAIILSGL